AQMAGVAASDWSWGPLFADFDNDGLKDLFISNGYLRDITDKDFLDYSNNLAMFKSQEEANKELLLKIRQLKGKRLPNRVFQNAGDVTFLPKFSEWGITQESCSNGAAYVDLDGDGDLDLVVNNINEAAFVYENKADKLLKNKYLNIKLEGLPANPAGIGASVTVVAGGKRQYVEQYLSRGFMSSVTPVLHVGLGENTSVDTLLMRWPNGKQQILTGVTANQTLTLKEADAQVVVEPIASSPASLMEDLSGENGLVFEHKALAFNDFLYQPLLPHLLSENGPCLAVGDLNGDGLEDFFVGGAKGQAGVLFFQKTDETFAEKAQPESAQFEDVGAVIFDANGDGHNDLFVASGGSTGPSGSAFYQSRLYLNDGKGNFAQNIKAIPDMRTPASCVAVADFDGDGDSDLFVGGSSEPGKYPLPARSYVLRNEGGIFTDVTLSLATGLEKPGIVTAAAFADLNHDGAPDLVLAGAWMPITVFLNKQGRFTDATAEMGLDKTSGWWNSLTVNDLDQDGDLDIVAGNIGLNTKYRQTPQQPVTIYAKDFDQNGSIDAVMCRFVDGREKPVHQRNELLAQIPGLGKKYPRYAMYAAASVQDMLGEKALSDAYYRSVDFFQTACFIQEKGRFKTKILPTPCQISPINALLCSDVNGDGRPDILMTGNSLAPNVATGQYDALNGVVLLGDGAGNFHPMPLEQSGFYVPGVGKSLAIIQLKSGNQYVLAGQHAGPLKVFGLSVPPANSNHKTLKPPPN
ncbi:MAG: FG-GAP-like repeat-containing protein, partial [Bacteroidota bacterium]